VEENVVLNNHAFVLHPTGAMYWEEKKMLFISDVHFGKISHFRKFGSAVPQNAISSNFERLTLVVEHYQPKIICFMGDLFHSSLNMEWDLFENWLRPISAQIILIAGNHDIISELKYEALGVKVASEFSTQGLYFTHHPEEKEGYYNICGHLHPGYKLRGLGRQQLNLRCFYKSPDRLILPAFGEFTGNFWISPNPGDQVFAITKKEVILVY
jgi:uncharacterized protein